MTKLRSVYTEPQATAKDEASGSEQVATLAVVDEALGDASGDSVLRALSLSSVSIFIAAMSLL